MIFASVLSADSTTAGAGEPGCVSAGSGHDVAQSRERAIGRGPAADALQSSQEAVEIGRRLAQGNSAVYLPALARALNNLGNMQLGMGQRADALQSAQEAVEIGTRLAQKNPDAYLPALATSLGAQGRILREHSIEASSQSFEEGIRRLSPRFFELPEAFASLMFLLVKDYVQTCQAGAIEPDSKLLAPVHEKLRTLLKQPENR
jgi:hypothetical protein